MKSNTKYSNPLDVSPGMGSPMTPAASAGGSVKRVNHAATQPSTASKDSEFTAPTEGNVLPHSEEKHNSTGKRKSSGNRQ